MRVMNCEWRGELVKSSLLEGVLRRFQAPKLAAWQPYSRNRIVYLTDTIVYCKRRGNYFTVGGFYD